MKKLKGEVFADGAGTKIEYEIGSGNVFADLDLPDADELFFKCRLMQSIAEVVRQNGWTQAQAAQALRLTQPRISQIVNGRAEGFSTDMLLGVLNRLGCDLEIRVKRRKATRARTRAVLTPAN